MAIDVSSHEPTARSRPGRLLGDVLVDLGFLGRDAVEAIVRDARAESRPMQHLLIERELITCEPARPRGRRALRPRLHEPRGDASRHRRDAARARSTLRRLQAVPIGFREHGTLVVAMSNPTNVVALDDLTMLTDLTVEPIVVSREDLETLLLRLGRLEREFIERGRRAEPRASEPDADPALEASVDDGPAAKLVRSLSPRRSSWAPRHPLRPRRRRPPGPLPHRRHHGAGRAHPPPPGRAHHLAHQDPLATSTSPSAASRRTGARGLARRPPRRHPRRGRAARRRRVGRHADPRSRRRAAVARRARDGRRRSRACRARARQDRTARSSRRVRRARASRPRSTRRSRSSARPRRPS